MIDEKCLSKVSRGMETEEVRFHAFFFKNSCVSGAG